MFMVLRLRNAALDNREMVDVVLVSFGCHNRIAQMRWLKFIFSFFWRLSSLRSKCHQDWLLTSSLFLACRWLPSCCVLTWPLLCARTCAEREQSLLFLISSYKLTISIGQMRWPQLISITSPKAPVSKWSHWEQELQHVHLWGRHNSVRYSEDKEGIG